METTIWDANMGGRMNAARWLERGEQILVNARRIRLFLEVQTKRHGLSEPELAVLWACDGSPTGGLGQNELAEKLAVSPAHVSAMVERLGRAKLLCGRAAADDRRRRLWEPTPAGMILLRFVVDGLTNVVQHRGAA